MLQASSDITSQDCCAKAHSFDHYYANNLVNIYAVCLAVISYIPRAICSSNSQLEVM